MTLALPGAPFPVTYRELWLPRAINENASLPTSVEGGHGLAFTGARRGTTCDGVHFTGAADSNMNCGALHNAVAKLWVSLRFKLDQPFSNAAATDQYLWGKWLDGDNYIMLYLESTDGRLYFKLRTLTVTRFSIPALDAGGQISSWEAGRWYNALCSISSVNGARFLLDNFPNTDADTNPAPNGGELIFGDLDDPGAGLGFQGVEVDIFIGTDDLSVAEEYNLYAGFPPADVVNEYPLDEGRGVTAYDRGSGGNNGTLDTTATWKFGQLESPVISLDGVNDVVIATNCDISDSFTMVWAGKIKSTYDTLVANKIICMCIVDANNYIQLFYNSALNTIRIIVTGGGAVSITNVPTSYSIDDYAIIMASQIPSGLLTCYQNGVLVGNATGALATPAGGGTFYLGRQSAAANYDLSKPLMVALIEGAFNQAQALAYSRYLKKVFNLPITI